CMYENGQGVDKDSEKAKEWLSKAKKQGNKDAEIKFNELVYKQVLSREFNLEEDEISKAKK
ncbi:MAG: SEL1-like repeat protein, partial [Elusimicrobia bacterium]|nr:SEL1-like repeat protein [Elusimicrobiota bacterium]